MTMPRFSIATLATAASFALLAAVATAQSAPAPQPVPTPGPNGTPVTFASTAPIGSPLPSAPAQPIATTVPTTAPNGHALPFRAKHETFVIGDYLVQPKVYNELSHGQQSTQFDYALRGATEFNLGSLPVMLEGETRRYTYRHESGLVTQPGGATQTFVHGAEERDDDITGKLGIKLLEPRLYLTAAYLDKRSTKDGVHLTGYGAGLEKLPDYGAPLGVYFSAFYYPNLSGQENVVTPAGLSLATLRYRVLTYQLGFSIAPGNSPIFIDLGALGDKMFARGNAPASITHLTPYAGIGFFSH